MGRSAEVRVVKDQVSGSWSVVLPDGVAEKLRFEDGERVDWQVGDFSELVLVRREPLLDRLKKKLHL